VTANLSIPQPPAGAQFGAFDGTIHVREGNATRPQTLKTAVTFAVVPLPPDPGDAGKRRLQGSTLTVTACGMTCSGVSRLRLLNRSGIALG